MKPAPAPHELPPATTAPPPDAQAAKACMTCHPLAALVERSREGYWHFEKVHRLVLERGYDCGKCHAELGTHFDPNRHAIDRLAQRHVCTSCHSGENR